MRRRYGSFWITASCIVSFVQPAAAQSGAPPRTVTIWDGVYTIAQAESGQRVVLQNCQACHSPSREWGDVSFIAGWDGQTIADLAQRLRSTMPLDRPGALNEQEYADVIAYMLELGNIPAGKNSLPTDRSLLEAIVVTRSKR